MLSTRIDDCTVRVEEPTLRIPFFSLNVNKVAVRKMSCSLSVPMLSNTFPNSRVNLAPNLVSVDKSQTPLKLCRMEIKDCEKRKRRALQCYTQRWEDNCRGWAKLECVNLISPWPQASLPFCRSETKVAAITQAAVCPVFRIFIPN